MVEGIREGEGSCDGMRYLGGWRGIGMCMTLVCF